MSVNAFCLSVKSLIRMCLLVVSISYETNIPNSQVDTDAEIEVSYSCNFLSVSDSLQ